MKALIDGDIIVYSAGFASDKYNYHLGGVVFPSKAEAKKYAATIDADEGDIILVVEPEELSHCLHSVKKMIENIIKKTGADDYEIYLTGEGNYREKLATIAPYKGNRDPDHKPYWYTEIKEYLVNTWEAKIIHGKEADDAMGFEQYKYIETIGELSDATIICSIDKDLDMIPGRHYNWRKDKKYLITREEATRFFYKQLLTGDKTDNIMGVPGIGDVRAEKIIGSVTNEEELFFRVFREYEKKYKKDAPKFMTENANLLWIQRVEDELWEPPFKFEV